MEGTEGTEFALGESVQENFALGTEVQVLQVTLELEHETRRACRRSRDDLVRNRVYMKGGEREKDGQSLDETSSRSGRLDVQTTSG